VSDAEQVLAALDTVHDPELDTSIVELGFVAACTVDGSSVEVRLRLPTFFCAPNFAFLMVADAHEAVRSVPGVDRVAIVLDDHFAAGEINAGVAAHAGFVGTFGDQAEAELDELRREFLGKAVLAGQDRVARPLLAGGRTPEELAELTLGDAPSSPDRERLRDRRRQLGIASSDGDPLLVRVDGRRVERAEVPVHLRRARTVRVSIEANGDYCRQLLRERYGRDPAGSRTR
jgi:metal-sulfur cluster biosynthetic enzyme